MEVAMKNIFTKFLSVLMVVSAFMIQTNLQAQFAEDAVAGANGNYGYGVTVDDDGNSYIIGRFAGTADFDPSSGTSELTANGSSDIYFAKYDVDGNLQWAKQIGKTSYAYGYGIALDGSGGLYITGYFKGTDVDFDPGAGTHNLSSAGNYDVFFAKYSAADGSYVWAKNIGGEDADNAYCLEVVGGYVYVVGRFQGDSDFDPDAGTVTLSSGSTSLYDVFFAKYNATDGSYVWAKDIGKTDRTEYAVDLAVDSDGNMHIVGWFYDTVDFDPDAGTVNLTSNGSRDVFFAKYKSADGSIIWAKNVGGSGGDDDYGYSIDVDANGNVYITGRFEGTGDYDPGAGTANISSNGDYDAFIAKYNSNGDYLWAYGVGGSDKVYGYNIISDGTDVYVAGKYKSTSDFGVNETISLTSAGNYDVWYGKYNASNGNSVWAKSVGGTDLDQVDYGNSIALGSFHITGYFKSTDADFDPDAGTTTLASAGNFDVFNAKYTEDGELPVELTTFTAQVNGNTVNLAWETATEVNNYGFNIERESQSDSWEKVGFIEGHGNSNSVKQYSFIDNISLSGKYSYRLQQIDIDGIFEYSNVIEVTVGVPQEFRVAQNYPNPFNPTTTISFSLPGKENVQVVVYNSLGEIVKTLVNSNLEAGVHTYNFDAKELGSGIYYYKVTAGSKVQTHKMILLK
jgi:hypothetical protein